MRYYALVFTADGSDLAELLVRNGLARIYGTRTRLPDGRDSRTFLAHLSELEAQAKTARRGGWGKAKFASPEKNGVKFNHPRGVAWLRRFAARAARFGFDTSTEALKEQSRRLHSSSTIPRTFSLTFFDPLVGTTRYLR